MYTENTLLKLRLEIEKQAQQIALLEDELIVTYKALQEKSAFASALEDDLEHAIHNLHKVTIKQPLTH